MATAASYRCDLGNRQSMYISNQGILTTVTVHSGGLSQQQQSSQAVSTGPWTSPPKIYQLGGGHVAVVLANQTFYLSIQGNQMQMNAGLQGKGIEQQIRDLEPLPMQPAEAPTMPAMQPMQPTQPMTMTMGNMSMTMGGEMKMGDTIVNAQSVQAEVSQTEDMNQQKFCSQCGHQVEASDRFCSQCGHQLA